MPERTRRQSVHRLLEPIESPSTFERTFEIAMGALILANVVVAIADSVDGFASEFRAAVAWFETFSVIVFTVEYLLRIWTSVEAKQFERPIVGRLKFLVTPMALLDLFVILPWYLPSTTLDLRFVRVVRLVRMMRVLKLARYSHALQTFGAVFSSKRADLTVILVFLSVMVVLASSFMYLAENPYQPETFSSIPAAMWWAISTLTTVGYGDEFPITPLGKAIGAVIAVIGIGFFALPAGVLAAAFADAVSARKTGATNVCPHCGEPL